MLRNYVVENFHGYIGVDGVVTQCSTKYKEINNNIYDKYNNLLNSIYAYNN